MNQKQKSLKYVTPGDLHMFSHGYVYISQYDSHSLSVVRLLGLDNVRTARFFPLLACVVDLDLFVDVVEDAFHLVLQTVQLTSFPLQPPLVRLIVLLQLCVNQAFQKCVRVRASFKQTEGLTGTASIWSPIYVCQETALYVLLVVS